MNKLCKNHYSSSLAAHNLPALKVLKKRKSDIEWNLFVWPARSVNKRDNKITTLAQNKRDTDWRFLDKTRVLRFLMSLQTSHICTTQGHKFPNTNKRMSTFSTTLAFPCSFLGLLVSLALIYGLRYCARSHQRNIYESKHAQARLHNLQITRNRYK